MLKKSKFFALKLAMTLISLMTFSLHAWAFNTQLCLNNEVEITTIIGFQNQTWCYVVKNINCTTPMALSPFRVDFLGVNPVGLVSSITSPPNYISGIYTLPPAPPCVFWLATTQPGIAPGTEKKFSFQTNNITGVAAQNVPSNIFAASLVPASLPEGPANATITEVSGTVEVRLSGTISWLPASVGMILNMGDTVRTWINGRVTVQLDEASTAELEPGTYLSIAGNAQQTTFIDIGNAFVDKIGKIFYKRLAAIQKFNELRSRNATCSIRGTEFSMEYSEIGGRQTTTVSVQSGEVEVADLSGGKLGAITLVPAGTTYNTPSGALPFLLPLLLID